MPACVTAEASSSSTSFSIRSRSPLSAASRFSGSSYGAAEAAYLYASRLSASDAVRARTQLVICAPVRSRDVTKLTTARRTAPAMATYKRGCESFNWLAIAASNAPKIENTNVIQRATSIRRLRASADLDHKDWRSAVSVNAVIFRVPHERAVADTMRASALLREKRQYRSSLRLLDLSLPQCSAMWSAWLVEDSKYYLMAL